MNGEGGFWNMYFRIQFYSRLAVRPRAAAPLVRAVVRARLRRHLRVVLVVFLINNLAALCLQYKYYYFHWFMVPL